MGHMLRGSNLMQLYDKFEGFSLYRMVHCLIGKIMTLVTPEASG